MGFIGNIDVKMDAKGRVFFPASFRKVLQASGQEIMIMRKNFYHQCISLYPENVWNEQMATLRGRLNMFNPQHQNIYREFLAGAEMVTLDGNGRILIPRGLVDMACIKQDVKILGLGESIELWALEKYMEQRMGSEEFGKALESVMCGPVF